MFHFHPSWKCYVAFVSSGRRRSITKVLWKYSGECASEERSAYSGQIIQTPGCIFSRWISNRIVRWFKVDFEIETIARGSIDSGNRQRYPCQQISVAWKASMLDQMSRRRSNVFHLRTRVISPAVRVRISLASFLSCESLQIRLLSTFTVFIVIRRVQLND